MYGHLDYNEDVSPMYMNVMLHVCKLHVTIH